MSSFTNNTTKATHGSSSTTSTSTTYGPAAGAIKQLNYDDSGSVNGLRFRADG